MGFLLFDRFTELGTSQKLSYIAGGVAVVTLVTVSAVTVVIKRLLNREKKIEYPRDVVILHQIGRGPYAPSLSPYVLKLETYLRMAKIPYQNVHSWKTSSKGKWPWIEYNGETLADTEFIILFLNKKFNVDLNKQLSQYDRAVANSIRVMADEHMIWCILSFRYMFDKEMRLIRRFVNTNRLKMWFIKRHVRKTFVYQGTGRHNKEEVTLLLERGLQVIADVLGQKRFLMGDKPCEADCAVFGHLSQLYWHIIENNMESFLKDKYPTLAAYCERMKSTYWPDWDECTTRGFTAEATK